MKLLFAKKAQPSQYKGYNNPNTLLEVGTEYEVQNVRVSGWFSTVLLKEFPGILFNSIIFENFDTQEAIEEFGSQYVIKKEGYEIKWNPSTKEVNILKTDT